MGGLDKALLILGGRPLIGHGFARLRSQVAAMLISANGDPARFDDWAVPVVADASGAPHTPLSGLAAALAHAERAGADAVLSAPCDTPFLPPDLRARLSASGGPAIAASRGQPHYLVGLWPVDLRPALEAFLAGGTLRVRDWVARCGAHIVEWPETPHDPFFNINTPEDLVTARSILHTQRPKILGVAGFKNAGKTTLVEKLVQTLSARGLRIATVKHAHHSFDIDHEGRDSFRHRKAGAVEVAIVSRERWALMHEARGDAEPTLDDILAKLAPCDLVLVEGYKRDTHEKIEVRNLALDHPKLAGDDPTIVAIAATGPVPDAPVPAFDRDDTAALVAFILRHTGLG